MSPSIDHGSGQGGSLALQMLNHHLQHFIEIHDQGGDVARVADEREEDVTLQPQEELADVAGANSQRQGQEIQVFHHFATHDVDGEE